MIQVSTLTRRTVEFQLPKSTTIVGEGGDRKSTTAVLEMTEFDARRLAVAILEAIGDGVPLC